MTLFEVAPGTAVRLDRFDPVQHGGDNGVRFDARLPFRSRPAQGPAASAL